ncbi:MAG: hypothetical protein M3Q10_04950 [Chloroflexota bacterium]|nr:hypothetical protein [Chloroflexota bacterium]
MAPAIAMPLVGHRPDLETFVGEFDRLLRSWRQPADQAMRVADVLAATTQKSAATFQELIHAMIAAVDPAARPSHAS